MSKFVIVDPPRSTEEYVGFAMNSPIEGWIFTTMLSIATRFNSEEAALKAIKAHYTNRRGDESADRLLVQPVSK